MRKTCSAIFTRVDFFSVRVLKVVVGSSGLFFLCCCSARFLLGGWRGGGNFDRHNLRDGRFGHDGGFFFWFDFKSGVFDDRFGDIIWVGIGGCGSRCFLIILASPSSTEVADIACTDTSTLSH